MIHTEVIRSHFPFLHERLEVSVDNCHYDITRVLTDSTASTHLPLDVLKKVAET